jgi:hypothetical protein
MTDLVVKGNRARELPRPNRTYGRDRVCADPECETRVSVYNKSEYCWSHAPQRFPLVRGERRRKAAA